MKIICLYKTRAFNSFIALIEPFYAGDHVHELAITVLPDEIAAYISYFKVFDVHLDAIRYAEIEVFGITGY